ncbi:MAG: response regulator, partial [Mucispirillum sp.]|nr:response regulator [Mucispirillum sp.]
IIQIISKRFAPKFQTFTSVPDTEEALKLFKSKDNGYDLVLIDYILPKMNGLEFAKEILKIQPKTAIILITGYVDISFLMEAVSIGISQFVSKPIQFKQLEGAINNATQALLLERTINENRKQELEILRYKDMYNTMEHEMIFKKELVLMRNDIFKKYISFGETSDTGWQLDTFYKSMHTVSGDTYTCRRFQNGNIFLFLADAMGHGVAASITSLTAVSLINYIVMRINTDNREFDMRATIDKTVSFISDMLLLEDEILSASFVYFDFIRDKLSYASFSMPRMLYEKKNGEVGKLASNNIPIMPYNRGINIDEVTLSDINKIAIFTDGIVESKTKDNVMYSAYLNEDFHSSPFLKVFMRNIYKHLSDFEDDTTILFFRRPYGNVIYEKTVSIPTKFDELDNAGDAVRDAMIENGIDPDKYDAFFAALSECLMNAYEHGNLCINSDTKHELIKMGTYDDELIKYEQLTDKKIIVRFSLCSDHKCRYMIISIRHEGDMKYPESVFKNALVDPMKFNGRGIRIIDYYTDALFFSEDRKEIFIGKVID